MRYTDHIVYTVPDFEKAMDWFEEYFGVRPEFGGFHKTQGTKNALLNLGKECYLEILAADDGNKEIKHPRWMGVDLIDKPQITRWALKSSELLKDSSIVKSYHPEMGNILSGQRTMVDGKMLTWQMIVPLATPEVEIIPFMVDWQDSETHPTATMPQHCELLNLSFAHPSPQSLRPIWEDLKCDTNINENNESRIIAEIKTPKGIIKI